MLWINLCAVVCLVLGFASGWRLIRKRRLPFAAGDAVLTWKENPASMFEQDRLGGISITFHACAIITLACLDAVFGQPVGSVSAIVGVPIAHTGMAA